MIGLEFECNPGYKPFLNDLLKNIDFSKLSVNILQQEIIYEGNLPCELYGKVTGAVVGYRKYGFGRAAGRCDERVCGRNAK